MESTELRDFRRRMRLRYEWSRARRALLGFAPAVLIIVAAVALTERPKSALVFGSSMFIIGVVLLWYGRDLRRAVLPGVVAGIVPLTFSLCANHIGHVCTGDSCMSWCVPACTAGGLAAGMAVAMYGLRRKHGLGFWFGASGITLLTGAMGCSCVGYSGVMGMMVGFGVGMLPSLVRRVVRF